MKSYGRSKKGTGKKPKGSGRRLYTDENPKDTVRINLQHHQMREQLLQKSTCKQTVCKKNTNTNCNGTTS